MPTPTQERAQALYARAMTAQNPVQYILAGLCFVKTPFELAPVIVALCAMEYRIESSDIPPRLHSLIREALVIAKLPVETITNTAPGEKLTADYNILPASDKARKEMHEYRQKHGLVAGLSKSRRINRRPPRFGVAGQLDNMFVK